MFGYLDAATGSMIVSAIAGGAAGLTVVGKTGMRRLKGKLSRRTGDESGPEQPAEPEVETETVS